MQSYASLHNIRLRQGLFLAFPNLCQRIADGYHVHQSACSFLKKRL